MARITSLVLMLALLLPFGLAAQQGAAAVTPGALTLGPGDMIRLQVYMEKDLTGEFLVNEDGVVTLPLLGDRQVAGIPIRQLRADLIAAYRAQIRNPAIEITPLRRVSVLGSVVRPGIYPVDPTYSLADAIALAGGASLDGDLNHVQIVRGGQVIRREAGIGERLATADIRSGDQIMIGRRSWFERNTTFLVSATLSVASIITGMLVARSYAKT
jgi:protein involved in polysaccharide export with SLBB domain